MGIGQGDHLARVRGIGQDFLVATHRRIEYHLAYGDAIGANSHTPENTAIFEGQYGRSELS
jgi:hypothetical protein